MGRPAAQTAGPLAGHVAGVQAGRHAGPTTWPMGPPDTQFQGRLICWVVGRSMRRSDTVAEGLQRSVVGGRIGCTRYGEQRGEGLVCMSRGSAFASSDTLGCGGLTWVVVLRSDPHSVPGRGRAAAQPCGREGVRVDGRIRWIRGSASRGPSRWAGERAAAMGGVQKVEEV